MTGTWDERIAQFWRDADDARPADLHRALDALLAERPADDPDALFERASLHDFVGEEQAAVPLYRAALDAGLGAAHRTEAVIQLASSLRNLGDPSRALALLHGVADDDPLADAARAFLALALFDDDKPVPALRIALGALAPHLPAYRRSIEAYAGDLVAPARVRNVVVGLLVRDGHVLAEEYAATAHHDVFLRAPGGGLDVGETTAAAIRREFAEELDVTLDDARPLGALENIFEVGPRRGHEIVHVFAVRSAQLERLSLDARLPVLDSDTTVAWYRLDALRSGTLPYYPTGILDLVS